MWISALSKYAEISVCKNPMYLCFAVHALSNICKLDTSGQESSGFKSPGDVVYVDHAVVFVLRFVHRSKPLGHLIVGVNVGLHEADHRSRLQHFW